MRSPCGSDDEGWCPTIPRYRSACALAWRTRAGRWGRPARGVGPVVGGLDGLAPALGAAAEVEAAARRGRAVGRVELAARQKSEVQLERKGDRRDGIGGCRVLPNRH